MIRKSTTFPLTARALKIRIKQLMCWMQYLKDILGNFCSTLKRRVLARKRHWAKLMRSYDEHQSEAKSPHWPDSWLWQQLKRFRPAPEVFQHQIEELIKRIYSTMAFWTQGNQMVCYVIFEIGIPLPKS